MLRSQGLYSEEQKKGQLPRLLWQWYMLCVPTPSTWCHFWYLQSSVRPSVCIARGGWKGTAMLPCDSHNPQSRLKAGLTSTEWLLPQHALLFCFMAPLRLFALPRVWPHGQATQYSEQEAEMAFCWFRATREELWLVKGWRHYHGQSAEIRQQSRASVASTEAVKDTPRWVR